MNSEKPLAIIYTEGKTDWQVLLPFPDHRVGYEHISIEFYFVDDEIKAADSEGRRLFLTSEFDKVTGSHKRDPSVHVLNQVVDAIKQRIIPVH